MRLAKRRQCVNEPIGRLFVTFGLDWRLSLQSPTMIGRLNKLKNERTIMKIKIINSLAAAALLTGSLGVLQAE